MSSAVTPELLASCDREPIHIPGAIQPHGLLLVMGPDCEIVAQAGDAASLTGPITAALEDLLGRPLATLWDEAPASGPALLGSVRAGGGELDLLGHRSGKYLVLEIERSGSAGLSAADALGAAQQLASRIEAAHDIEEACRDSAEAVHALTGYGRIMVYRFLADGAGAVVAEAKDPAIPSLLNHHFPASDIPQQARQLYARNHVRVIPDVSYTPAPLVWTAGGSEPESLDMSDCHLRSVSPIHIQYLRNMEVGASASISIMVSGELWGLIACHNPEPKPLGYVQRELCKHIGQLLGGQIAARQRSSAQMETVRLARSHDELMRILSGLDSVEESMLQHPEDMLRAVPSDGVAVIAGDRIVRAGTAPGEEQLRELIPELMKKAAGRPFETHRLASHFAAAEAFASDASGALCCVIRSEPRLAVSWFRAERVQTVNWAGNPHKPVDTASGTLTPRKSFELWCETVRGEARRWSGAEVDAADRLRSATLELLDQQALRSLNRQLRQALAEKEELLTQKDMLMREVHHRVQNSLQLVNAMLHLQERDAGSPEVSIQFSLARQRLTAIAMVHRRLWRADKLGDVRLDTFIAELVEELVKIWGEAWRSGVRLELAPITLPTDKGILVGLIVTELMTNAVKYAYGGDAGPLTIGIAEDGRGGIRLSVADRGVGMSPGATESFGTRLTSTLVRQLGGRIDIRDNGPGARVVLEFPLGDRTGA